MALLICKLKCANRSHQAFLEKTRGCKLNLDLPPEILNMIDEQAMARCPFYKPLDAENDYKEVEQDG